MTVKEKIQKFLYERDNSNITPVIEFINHLLYIAAAYNQMWQVETRNVNGKVSLVLVDDITQDVKVIFDNPDIVMQKAIQEIDKIGWIGVKEKYLYNDIYNAEEQRITIMNNNDHFSPIYSEI